MGEKGREGRGWEVRGEGRGKEMGSDRGGEGRGGEVGERVEVGEGRI